MKKKEKCFYCQNPSHWARDCRKKKVDIKKDKVKQSTNIVEDDIESDNLDPSTTFMTTLASQDSLDHQHCFVD